MRLHQLMLLAIVISLSVLACQDQEKVSTKTVSEHDLRVAEYKPVYQKKLKELKTYHSAAQQLEDGTVYQPNYFVLWHEDKTDAEIARLLEKAKNKFGEDLVEVDSCGCGREFRVKLWRIDGSETTSVGKDKDLESVGVQEKEENLYTSLDRPFSEKPNANTSFNALPNNFTVAPTSNTGNSIKIAVLDTGIDYQFQERMSDDQPILPLWKNPNEVLNGKDEAEDKFCLIDDIIGYDFVNNDNNPMDDHSHGTHIAGIIAQQIAQHQPALSYQLMPIKILDKNGTGNTFKTACGILYAAKMGADIINLSAGYYGKESKLLRAALQFALRKNVLTVNAVGNEGVDVVYAPYYPASFVLEDSNRVLGISLVSALNADGTLHKGSNFRTNVLEGSGFMALPGEKIKSLIPIHLADILPPEKSGTSVATPIFTAMAAVYRSKFPKHNANKVRQNLWRMATDQVEPLSFNRYGEKHLYHPISWLEIDTAAVLRIDANAIN